MQNVNSGYESNSYIDNLLDAGGDGMRFDLWLDFPERTWFIVNVFLRAKDKAQHFFEGFETITGVLLILL